MKDKEKAQNNTEKNVVPANYLKIFALRITGVPLYEIAEKVDLSYDYIRHLFDKNGALNEMWTKWLEEAKADNVDTAFGMIYNALPKIIQSRIDHATSTKMGSTESSKLLLGYILGSPDAPRNYTQINNFQVDPEKEKEIIKVFTNFGLISDKNASKNNASQRSKARVKKPRTA